MSQPCITFESLCISTDVTCVKCYGDYVLAGTGSWFSIYCAETSKCLLKDSVFHGQRIHGIVPLSLQKIAVFGGRQFVFLHLKPNFKGILNKVRCHVDEWIIELQWLECGSKFAILTADSVISLWKMNGPEQLAKVSCELNCLIYSALILKESWSNLIVLSGTAFGKIVIWKPVLNLAEKHERILHTLNGHDGVVSSVSYDAESSVICSTSDDRSVRIWKVSMNPEGSWETASIQLVHSLYGHTARVWKAVTVDRIVVSVGEDSFVMVWGPEGELLKQWKYPQSSTIWSMDYSIEKKIVVVGGSDGGVIAWPFNIWREESLKHAQLSLHRTSNNSVNNLNHTDSTIIRRIVILKDNHIVALTKNAALWHYDDCHGAECKFTFDCKRFSNICLLDISPSRTLLAIASCDGEIIVMSDTNCYRGEPLTKLVQVHSLEGGISSLHWAADDYLLICSSAGAMELWKLNLNASKVTDGCHSLTCVHKFSLPPKKRSSIMTAVIHDNQLIFGDRTGNIHVNGVINTDDNNKTDMLDKLHTKHQHGKESVTFLMGLKSEVMSVGRDGMFCWFAVANRTLHDVSVCRLPMEWPARILMANSGILIAGFVDVKFILWSHEEKRILLEVQCGGGHRAWDCAIIEDIFTFIYLKDNVIHRCICNLVDLTRPHLQKGFHLKDINCQKLICERTVKIPYRLVACGSENNTVYLIFLQAGMAPTVAAVLDTHISSVRTLDVCCLRKSEVSDSFLLVTAGGRAQLKVWKIVVSHSEDEGVLPKVYCSEVYSDILNKGGGKKKAPWKSLQPMAEADMRYMDVCILQTEHTSRDACKYTAPSAFILAGCSDGNWRLLNYDIHCGQLNFLKEFPVQACILKVCYLCSGSHCCVLAVDTNGYLKLWDITIDIHNTIRSKFQVPDNHRNSCVQTEKQRQPFFSLKVHQTGINSSDTFSISSERFVIGTGGDDNAVALSMFDFNVENSGDLGVVCVSQWKDTTAHLAQITGLRIFNGFIITGSVDQRITLWSWSYLSCKLNAVKLQSFCSTITDIKGFLAWRTENGFTISLHGQGMELIRAVVNDDLDTDEALKV